MNKKAGLIIVGLLVMVAGLYAQEWQTDFDQAKKIANEENKPIVLVFQGSDWCAPCIKMERDIWNSDFFKENGHQHFVLLKADFPRRKKNALPEELAEQNAQLAERYNLQGAFPLVVLLDEKGELLGQTGMNKMKPEEYLSHLQDLAAVQTSD